MRTQSCLCTSILSLLTLGAAAHAGTFSTSLWTGDGDSGISSATNYTAKADFNGDGTRVINGVSFTTGAAISSTYALTLAPNAFNNNVNSLTGSSNAAASDFFYGTGNGGNAYLTLGNLVVGQTYTTTWYNVGFGSAGARQINITPGDTNVPFLYDENQNGNGNGSILKYTFVAQKPVMTYGFDAVADADTFHHYLMTNAGPTGSSAFVTPTYASQSGAAPFTPTFQPLSNDLLQTKLASTDSTGNFTLEGTGGVPILTNGQFTIANAQLATGGNNSTVVFTLDLTGAPRGYDISKIVGYGGWNDSGRDRQLFQVSYSLIGDANFAFLGQADFDPSGLPGGTPSAIQSTFNTALTGVDAIRIDFPAGQENTYAGYGEFDVVGTATVVPEPGAAGLLCLGMAAVAMRRRRA